MLKLIKSTDPLYPQAERLFIGAFPANERRNLKAQRDNTDNNPLFRYYAIVMDNEFAGILTAWDFSTFRYIEHFAIVPEKRSAGIGAKALRQFIEMCVSPIVLEVEIPLDDMSVRRIDFYRRQGLSLWENIDYYQPPYHEGDGILPMRLMTTDGLDHERDFEKVKCHLYKYVYNYSERE